MKTITFYSYKGGTGRSLALANAARYLARLEFSVVAVDFDLEAPGLHYKFSVSSGAEPVEVTAGVVDYLFNIITKGKLPEALDSFIVNVTVPGIDKPLIHLLPAGRAPSKEYFSALARINWHDLFYSKDSQGVQLFLELKNQIAKELNPDFLLIDSRTGITEMSGAATSLLADKIVCLVIPTLENLEGTRSVLRSLKRSRQQAGLPELEFTVALARIPESDREREDIERIRSILNESADDPSDTLSCNEVFVLHSDAALQARESLYVGGDVSPDDSLLLRDYLRLFANMVPRGLVESKVGKLIEQAKAKIWDDAEAALKEVEELAESFGHPEIYRELLRFYDVRNIRGTTVIRRSQRLWELTRDSHDQVLWQGVRRSFEPRERWLGKAEGLWPNIDFLAAVWRDAGNYDLEFSDKLVNALVQQNRESRAADILLELIEKKGPTPGTVARCIHLLDVSDRSSEADDLIERTKSIFVAEPKFLESWARHLLRNDAGTIDKALVAPGTIELLSASSPITAARLCLKLGMIEQCRGLAESILASTSRERPVSTQETYELAELFGTIGQWEEFEAASPAFRRQLPPPILEELRQRFKDRSPKKT